ncbi:MAG: hypothetical protein WCQ48_08595 [Chloroflexota bacterium]
MLLGLCDPRERIVVVEDPSSVSPENRMPSSSM